MYHAQAPTLLWKVRAGTGLDLLLIVADCAGGALEAIPSYARPLSHTPCARVVQVKMERNELESALFREFQTQAHWKFDQLQVSIEIIECACF